MLRAVVGVYLAGIYDEEAEGMTLDEVINDMAGKTVCLDFDGVLAKYTGWKGEDNLGEPYPGTREFLEAIKSMGFDIVIHTVRKAGKVWDWLHQYHVAHLVEAVTSIKPPAHAYIDDRSICHRGDFGRTLWALKRFRAHWEEANGQD